MAQSRDRDVEVGISIQVDWNQERVDQVVERFNRAQAQVGHAMREWVAATAEVIEVMTKPTEGVSLVRKDGESTLAPGEDGSATESHGTGFFDVPLFDHDGSGA